MSIQYAEARGGTWKEAADRIIARITYMGAKQGQVFSIDAHNNGPEEEAIFSALWDNSIPRKSANSISGVREKKHK